MDMLCTKVGDEIAFRDLPARAIFAHEGIMYMAYGPLVVDLNNILDQRRRFNGDEKVSPIKLWGSVEDSEVV